MRDLILQVIAPIVAAFATWFFTKRQYTANSTSIELDNAIKAVKYYRETIDDLGPRLKTAYEELADLEDKYRDIIRRYEALEGMNRDLLASNEKLTESNQKLMEEIQKFKQLNGRITS